MFIPNNVEECVALIFRTMIFTEIKGAIKKVFFKIDNLQNSEFLVFSILQQSTTSIMIKATLTFSAVRSTFNNLFFFLHKSHQQYYFNKLTEWQNFILCYNAHQHNTNCQRDFNKKNMIFHKI